MLFAITCAILLLLVTLYRDMYGQTSLHLVAQFGAINLIETLLSFEGLALALD